MAVYVDPLMQTEPSLKWPYKQSCHLTADSLDELHNFAVDRLGLREAWFQYHVNPKLCHYDLTASKRALALRCGAIAITGAQLAERLFANRGDSGQPELSLYEALHVKCLSIRQPYATFIVMHHELVKAGFPPKFLENRTWRTEYRGPILIHAAQRFESGSLEFWKHEMPGLFDVVPKLRKDYPIGQIIGIADLVDCIDRSSPLRSDPWFRGPYAFEFANIRPIKPIVWSGRLGLFNVPRAAIEELAS